VNNSTLNVFSTEFASNTGNTSGAIFGSATSKINIKNSTLTNNQGQNAGAIAGHMSNLWITNSHFASNTADLKGGGFHVESSNATVTGTQFLENQANQGAAIGILESTVTIDACLFEDNELDGVMDHHGGGIFTLSNNTNPDAVMLTDSTFTNMEAEKGAGVYIETGGLTLYGNTFEDLNTTEGGAVYAHYASENESVLYNEDGARWKWFNVPDATVEFVENTANNNNTYNNCTINGDQEAEGAKISYGQRTTPTGTLTVRPEEGEEQSMVILSIDYLTGMAFKGGTLTICVPTGFEITDDASVTIEGQPATAASHYNPATQTMDITGIALEEVGTITLKLEEQEVPEATTTGMSARDRDYHFTAIADADGSGTAWTSTDESTAVFISTEISEFAGGSGTIEDPYQIANFTHLNNMRKYLDAHFILIDDIGSDSDPELSNTNERGYRFWNPIGSFETPFTGSFDGCGHYIGGLAMASEEELLLGFYLYTDGAVIENLTLSYFSLLGKIGVGALTGYASGTTFKDINIKGGSIQGSGNVGSVAGSCSGSVFENIQVTGLITVSVTCGESCSEGEGDYAGGLVGWCDASTITNSSFRGELVLAKGNFVGGLVGTLQESVVSSSYVNFDDSGSLIHVSGEESLGGFVGSNKSSTITNCFAQANASGTVKVGGFVGWNRKLYDGENKESTIINAYSTGEVTGDDSFGGFCGYNAFDDSYIKNCFWDTSTSEITDSDGGTGEDTEAMQKQSTFTDWDFVNTWNIESNSYPNLRSP